eukprot:5466270-Ditylum_brightwellii.AAC.1
MDSNYFAEFDQDVNKELLLHHLNRGIAQFSSVTKSEKVGQHIENKVLSGVEKEVLYELFHAKTEKKNSLPATYVGSETQRANITYGMLQMCMSYTMMKQPRISFRMKWNLNHCTYLLAKMIG